MLLPHVALSLFKSTVYWDKYYSQIYCEMHNNCPKTAETSAIRVS
jgi:hypothetical protein